MATYNRLTTLEVKVAMNKVSGEVKRVTVKKVMGTLFIPPKEKCVFNENEYGPFVRFKYRSPYGEFLSITVFNYKPWFFGKVIPVSMEIYIKSDKNGWVHLAAKANPIKRQKGMKQIWVIPDYKKVEGDPERHVLVYNGKKSPVIVIK